MIMAKAEAILKGRERLSPLESLIEHAVVDARYRLGCSRVSRRWSRRCSRVS